MKLPALLLSAVLSTTLVSITSLIAMPGSAHAAAAHEGGIAWQQGDVDAAFALAKASNKPLFLYWGAVWCPPCNQVKATIFNRQDFIERSKFFVPVYIDGDSASAQKLGTRFKVRGYPSMILFKPDGTEIIRLPGEVDGSRYLQVLQLGMNAAHPVKDTLKVALTEPAKVSADEWRLLSFYSWDTDEQQLVGKDEIAPTLLKLAKNCTQPESAQRLELKAWSAMVGLKTKPEFEPDLAAGRLLKILWNPKQTRENMDILTLGAADLTELVSSETSTLRGQLYQAWGVAMPRLMNDTTISKADRVAAINAQIAIARLATPKGPLPPELVQSVQQRIAELDKNTDNAYERQAVISDAAHALTDAGLMEQSDALLKAELKRSQSPYYYMLVLASNAKKRDDKAAALNWYEQAYQSSKGPATRLQWGATYLTNLLDLAPQDDSRIEKAASGVLTELAATPDAFYERSRRNLERIGEKMLRWNKDGQHKEVFGKVQTQLGGICSKLPAKDDQRAVCEGLLSAPKAG